MKTLLILLNISNSSDSRRLQPLGISYIASALRNCGQYCDVLDCNLINNFKDKDLLKRIEDGGYQIVGFSIFSSSYKRVVNIARKIKRAYPEIWLAAGGIHSTICHKNIIKESRCFDFSMRGDGERQFVELVRDLEENGRPTKKIEGISYKNINGKEFFSDVIYQEQNLDILTNPIRENFKDYSKRFDPELKKELFNVGISSSRGCPYHCTFCSVPCMNLSWRGRSEESVSEEIYNIYKEERDIFIIFIDDNFFVDPNRAKNIITLTERKCGTIIPFSFATRANQVIKAGTPILKWFKEHGCRAIEIGIENGSDAVLLRMKKGTTVKENEKALELLNLAGMNPGIDFIMFDAYTTLQELQENVEFLKRTGIWGYYPALVYKRIIPYPGTEVEKLYEGRKKYFNEKVVSDIFKYINIFFIDFALKIEGILKEKKVSNMKIAWIKVLPYTCFEELLNNGLNGKKIRSAYRKFKKSIEKDFDKCYNESRK